MALKIHLEVFDQSLHACVTAESSNLVFLETKAFSGEYYIESQCAENNRRIDPCVSWLQGLQWLPHCTRFPASPAERVREDDVYVVRDVELYCLESPAVFLP